MSFGSKPGAKVSFRDSADGTTILGEVSWLGFPGIPAVGDKVSIGATVLKPVTEVQWDYASGSGKGILIILLNLA